MQISQTSSSQNSKLFYLICQQYSLQICWVLGNKQSVTELCSFWFPAFFSLFPYFSCPFSILENSLSLVELYPVRSVNLKFLVFFYICAFHHFCPFHYRSDSFSLKYRPLSLFPYWFLYCWIKGSFLSGIHYSNNQWNELDCW